MGNRSVVLSAELGDNEQLLESYLWLVADQRAVDLDPSIVVRRDDIRVLAELLDLDDTELEQKLVKILQLSAPEAAELRRLLLRHRMAFAAAGVGLLTAVPAAAVLAGADEERDLTRVRTIEAPATSAIDPVSPASPVTIETSTTTTLPPPTTSTTVPAPTTTVPPPTTAPPDPSVDIGYSVTYERDPDFVPPEGVEIGDAMVIEREPPPV